MTDDRTIRMYTHLATLDYDIDESYNMKRQLDEHRYEDTLVLEPSYDFSAPVIIELLYYFIKKGYTIDTDYITDDINESIILVKNKVVNRK